MDCHLYDGCWDVLCQHLVVQVLSYFFALFCTHAAGWRGEDVDVINYAGVLEGVVLISVVSVLPGGS